MTTEADRELARETARNILHAPILRLIPEEKIDCLSKIVLATFAKRDALKAEKLEAEAFQRKLDNEP
jgi:hypothetical protein